MVLERYVLSYTGRESEDVVVKPRVGIDFAAIKTPKGYLICSSDPITGIGEDVGWYGVNVSANDVATSGAKPSYISSTILLPPNTILPRLKGIVKQVHEASKELGITVVGGHTELTPDLDRPIIITTCFGFTDRYITSADAKEGDTIMMTKTAAIEGTAILASLFKKRLKGLGNDVIDRALEMRKEISVVKEASLAFATGFVNAMHDVTEGGILGGIDEMAEASGLGFIVYEDIIPIADETRRICSELKVD
ncbi:MAG: AIR synthase related protein, partial [Nitrososphaerota archaeon]